MELKIIKSFEELDTYKSSWYSILEENGNSNLYLTYDWISRWWLFFGKEHELFFIILLHNSNAIGFCPLMKTKKGLLKEISFIGYDQAVYMDFIVTNVHRKEFISKVLEYLLLLKGCLLLKLHGLPEDSATLMLLKDYLGQNKVKFFLKSIESLFIKANGRSFDSYFKDRCTYKRIKNVSQDESKLCELGDLSWQKVNADTIDEIFDLHKKRWRKKRDGNGFADSTRKIFFKYLALDSSILDFMVSAAFLKINNRTIGFNYGFLCNKKYIGYRLAFDDDFAAFSPGKIVVKNAIKQSFNSNCEIFDFLTGNDSYKYDWTDESTMIYTLVFKPNNKLSYPYYKFSHIYEGVRNFMKKKKSVRYLRTLVLGKIKYLFSIDCLSYTNMRLNSSIAKEGVGVLLANTVRSIPKVFYDYEKYLVLKQAGIIGILENEEKAYSAYPASLEDMQSLSMLMNTEVKTLTKRFYQKQQCLVMKYENVLIGYAWINYNCVNIKGVQYLAFKGKNNACIYDLFISKKYRSEAAGLDLLKYVLKHLHMRSYSNIYILLNKSDKKFSDASLSLKFQVNSAIKIYKPFYRREHIIKDLLPIPSQKYKNLSKGEKSNEASSN